MLQPGAKMYQNLAAPVHISPYLPSIDSFSFRPDLIVHQANQVMNVDVSCTCQKCA